jgi:hypothetical protein
MTTTKEDIASRAFLLVGGNPVTDFDSGESQESDLANILYEEIVQAELGSYPWNFAKSKVQLSRDSTDPIGSEWSAQYLIDVAAITIRGVLVESNNIQYEIQGTRILCDASTNDTVIMEYLGRPDEAQWPPYFQLAMIYRLAGDFGGSLARDGELVEAFENKYMFQLRRAKAMDSQSETSRPLRTRRLINARRGGGRYFPGGE